MFNLVVAAFVAVPEAAFEPAVFLHVTINPEGRVKLRRGPAEVRLTKDVPAFGLLRIENQSGGQQALTAHGAYAGGGRLPFTLTAVGPPLSGREVEYRRLRIVCSASGRREVTVSLDAGQGTQDLGFRGEVPVLFEVR